MKKILLVVPYEFFTHVILSYFIPYLKKKDKDYDVGYHISWSKSRLISAELKELLYEFEYQNFLIHVKLLSSLSSEEYANEILISKIYQNYDEVVLIQRSFFFKQDESGPDFDFWNHHEKELSKFIDKTQLNKFRTVFISLDENLQQNTSVLKQTLENCKVITSCKTEVSHPNILNHYRIHYIFFYYLISFYVMNFDKINNKKENLIGCYYKPNYRVERDNKMNEYVEEMNQSNIHDVYTQYDSTYDYDDDYVAEILLNKLDWWFRNHISSYTDYIRSVVSIINETEVEMNKEHFTEKIIKGILFSKVGCIFIVNMDSHMMYELKKDGMWFLNFDFFDWNEFEKHKDNLSEESYRIRVRLVNDSVKKSIRYIASLYHENDKDLDVVYSKLIEMNYGKMLNNYDTYMKYIKNPYDKEKIINFILSNDEKNN